MNYKQVLRYQPWLKLVNMNQISSRLLQYTHGDIFLAYDTVRGTYELHSVTSFRVSESSYNATFDQEFINGFILEDYKMHNLRQNKDDLTAERERKQYLYDKREKERLNLDDLMRKTEKVLGVKV